MTNPAESMDDAVLANGRQIRLLSGASFEVRELSLNDLASIVRKLKPFKERLDAGAKIESLLIEEFDAMMPVIVLLTGMDSKQLGALKLSEATRLVESALEVNAGFFINQVIPMLPRLLGRLTAKMDGLTPSTFLSGQVTSAAKSLG